MAGLPSHASPELPASQPEAHPSKSRPSAEFFLNADNDRPMKQSQQSQRPSDHPLSAFNPPPPSLLSPAFTPPTTPGGNERNPFASDSAPRSVPVDTTQSTTSPPALLEKLPEVRCVVRARIPTTNGQEMFLHLYHNNEDNKEHLAIVFGRNIRSKTLDAPREGETEYDRMVRGAYVGRLHPGRTSSRYQEIKEGGGGELPQSSSASTTTAETETDKDSMSTSMTSESALNALGIPAPLVRIHSECYTGETVWSARCDCGEQLDEAARLMSHPTAGPTGGVIIYLRQEGRGIGLGEKLKAYNLQDLGNDTVEANILLRHPADARSYGLATAMLVDLGLGGERGIRLLTNNPDKVRAVEGPEREVEVKERVAMVPLAWKTGGKKGFRSEEVDRYLSTKIEKFKHLISEDH